MNQNDSKKFAELLTGIAELYGKKYSSMMLELYWNALSAYSYSEVERAVQRHMKNPDSGQFFPKPADIIRHLEGSNETKAMLAWTKVIKAIGSVGPYDSVVFDDALIHAVISDMGGWIELGKITEDQVPFVAREFEKRYQGYAIRPVESYPKRLIGIAEAQNTIIGIKSMSPRLIGNPIQARLIYERGETSNDKPVLLLEEHFRPNLSLVPIKTPKKTNGVYLGGDKNDEGMA